MDPFLIFSDWRNIALISTIALIWLNIFAESKYAWLWKKLQWNYKLVISACLGVSILFIREFLVMPFSWVATSWPTLSPVAQFLLYGDSIHFRSLLFFSALIILLWRKYASLLPALAVGWFCLGIVELTFIPQHLAKTPGRFIGWDWYLPFIGICFYFLIIHKCFRFTRKFWLFFSAAIFIQYFMLIFYPYWLVIYNAQGFGYVLNYAVLPDPPIQTWIFWFLNHFMKALFTIAFYFVEKIKDDVPLMEHAKKAESK